MLLADPDLVRRCFAPQIHSAGPEWSVKEVLEEFRKMRMYRVFPRR